MRGKLLGNYRSTLGEVFTRIVLLRKWYNPPMVMAKKYNKKLVRAATAGAMALSLWFVYSVAMNARDLVQHGVKNAPASYALILCLILLAYSWYKNDKKLRILHIITLTILATSIFIWAAGLSTQPIR